MDAVEVRVVPRPEVGARTRRYAAVLEALRTLPPDKAVQVQPPSHMRIEVFRRSIYFCLKRAGMRAHIYVDDQGGFLLWPWEDATKTKGEKYGRDKRKPRPAVPRNS